MCCDAVAPLVSKSGVRLGLSRLISLAPVIQLRSCIGCLSLLIVAGAFNSGVGWAWVAMLSPDGKLQADSFFVQEAS